MPKFIIAFALSLGLAATATATTTATAHADDSTTTTPPAKPKCADVAKSLQQVYQNLYNVDTRPLQIDAYRSYRDGIESLRQQTSTLESICNDAAPAPSNQVLYKSLNLSWGMGYSFNDICGSADFSKAESDFAETSIRECFRDGYKDCTVTRPARVFNFKDTQNSDNTWACTAELDMLLNATK